MGYLWNPSCYHHLRLWKTGILSYTGVVTGSDGKLRPNSSEVRRCKPGWASDQLNQWEPMTACNQSTSALIKSRTPQSIRFNCVNDFRTHQSLIGLWRNVAIFKSGIPRWRLCVIFFLSCLFLFHSLICKVLMGLSSSLFALVHIFDASLLSALLSPVFYALSAHIVLHNCYQNPFQTLRIAKPSNWLLSNLRSADI